MFGFHFNDDHRVWIDLERDGRHSRISLVGEVQIDARDPRDRWLLQASDDEIMPVELRLGLGSGDDVIPFVEEDMLDGRVTRTTVRTIDELMDVLPPLGPSNSVGYHRARERIIAAFEELRPKSWADVGITDVAEIAEYERYSVNADHVAHARANGRGTRDEIIRGYGLPPDADWVRVEMNDGD